jgi:hypothetical protein
MSFTDKQQFNVPRHIVQKGGVNIEAISGNRTLTYLDSQYQRLDASAGSLEVILPEEKDGAMFVINCQSNSFTVKDAAGTTIKILSTGEGAMFCCDGSAWKQFI